MAGRPNDDLRSPSHGARDAVLARISSVPAINKTARQAKLLWKRMFFWPLNALRKPRLRKFGLALNASLPVARLRLDADCGCSPSDHFAPLSWDAIKSFTRAGKRAPVARSLAPTATVLALDQFASFDAWRAQVSRTTQGKYHRSANKARRLGYASRFVGENAYARSLYELTGSKPRRSKGVIVWAAIAGPRFDLVDTKESMLWPTCPRHWRINWGAFRTDEAGEERLSCFAMLVRSGDVIWVQQFIGHGAALSDGVTKMLMFDIMQWLLERRDPCARGARFLVHGSMEEGGVGLFDWKRYLGFRPMLLETLDRPR